MLWMDRALSGYKLLIVLKIVFAFSKVLHKGCLIVCYWGNPLANVYDLGVVLMIPIAARQVSKVADPSEVVGNPQTNLFEGGQRVLATLWQICKSESRVLATFDMLFQ